MSEKIERSLVKKLALVMAAVKRIPKNGFNKNQHYPFVMESDVLDVVRDELSARHVMVFPRVLKERGERIATKSGGEQCLVTLEVEFTFVDGESGESQVASAVGQGMDSGDKAAAKATTMATKYALMKTFLIPTGDDPEADEAADAAHSEVRATKPQLPPAARATTHNPQTGEVSAPGAVFPNYGKTAGQPVKGASFNDLQFYKNGAIRSLNDPAKKSFHAKDQALLAAIENELNSAGAPPVQEDAPF